MIRLKELKKKEYNPKFEELFYFLYNNLWDKNDSIVINLITYIIITEIFFKSKLFF